jgi:hypothetical protein
MRMGACVRNVVKQNKAIADVVPFHCLGPKPMKTKIILDSRMSESDMFVIAHGEFYSGW